MNPFFAHKTSWIVFASSVNSNTISRHFYRFRADFLQFKMFTSLHPLTKIHQLINLFETKNSQFYFHNENYHFDSVRDHCSGTYIGSPSSSSFASSAQKNWPCSRPTGEIHTENRSHKASCTDVGKSADLGLYHWQPVSFATLSWIWKLGFSEWSVCFDLRIDQMHLIIRFRSIYWLNKTFNKIKLKLNIWKMMRFCAFVCIRLETEKISVIAIITWLLLHWPIVLG